LTRASFRAGGKEDAAFFLHVRDGPDLISDPDGSCFPDVDFAKSEAILSARELMSQSIIRGGRLGIDRRFEIADQEGNTVAIVPFREAVN
jgi:hypothetical protein